MELTISRRGSIKLCIDLRKRLLRWRESNRWNRNFTRTLSQLEVAEFYDLLRRNQLERWPQTGEGPTGRKESDFSSRLCIQLSDAEGETLFRHLVYDNQPEYLFHFCEAISVFCRQKFTIGD